MTFNRFWRLARVVAPVLLGACAPSFQLKNYSSNEALYRASQREYERRKWDHAITGFEKLTNDLPARDSLLGRSYFYLAQARERNGEHLLAAQTFTRLAETFPEDTLADDALFRAGKAYESLWRKPVLDAMYGEMALNVFRTMVAVNPTSPLLPQAQAELAKLDDWFARKDYETGMHYMRRKAYDSAILYFKDVIKEHPDAPQTRLAHLRLLEAYRLIHYREESAELCAAMRAKYPNDREVLEACPAPATPAPAKPTP